MHCGHLAEELGRIGGAHEVVATHREAPLTRIVVTCVAHFCVRCRAARPSESAYERYPAESPASLGDRRGGGGVIGGMRQ